MRLDADEFLDKRLVSCLRDALMTAGEDVGGFEVNRRIRFMGQEIRHGGMSPMWVIRFWRNGWGSCENRWMDEHIVLAKGKVVRLPGAIIDENLNSLTWWTQKHNLYANREAVDLLNIRYEHSLVEESDVRLNHQARLKRLLKTKIYAKLPLGFRPWHYYFYCLILRFGFLDGSKGIMFHTLQGFWYRSLVDAKVAEVEDYLDKNHGSVREAILKVLNIDLGAIQKEPHQKRGGIN